jgi:hypothetical protein
MAFLIGLQSGHQDIAKNIDPLLAKETGAPGEEAFNVKVRDTLSPILIAYGFQVQLDDANANSNVNTLSKDFAFYLAIHAEGAPAGGNVVAPDPSVDANNTESKRIVAAIKGIYFNDTGIKENGISTENETFYYMWNVLTAKTPCGIIECGDLQDAHDSVILNDVRRVALGIAHGICVAFNIEWHGDPLHSSPSSSTSPSASRSPSISPSASISPSSSASPSAPAIMTCETQALLYKAVINDKWSWFGDNGWKSQLMRLRVILNGK